MSLSTNMVAGLSSGFDWRTMIDQLIAVEHRNVDLVEDKKADYQAQLSEWQSFNTKLLALKTAAEGLKDPEDFYLYTSSMTTDDTNVDGEDLLSVSTSTSAARGNYTIKVTNLATAQKLSSNPFTSQSAELGSSYAGDILLNGKVVTINATDTLANVAYNINAVNSGTNPSGVTASIVNYGTNDYRLILTSDATGADGISLLNGSSVDLVQKFGWKDNQAAAVKNSITNGAQSDRFTAPNVAIKSLLGLATGETSTGTLTIAGTAVTINLASMSLNDIKDAINNASISGVSASVISQTEDGTTYYRLQIDGTQTFVDEKNILNTLGLLDHTSVDVTGQVSANSMTTEGAYITSTTLLTDIDGYNTFTSGGYSTGDYITLTGTNTSNGNIGTVYFDITSATTVQDLLDEIETRYGDVVAYVTSDGKIKVDDLTGGSYLDVNLATTLQDAGSQLNFGAFGAAAARKREVVAAEDASVQIDGVTVTDASNVIDDVIPGVTLNLVSEDSTTTVTLNIERDINTIKGNVQTFVDNYNAVLSYINTQFAYDAESEEAGGLLFGDSTLRSIKSDCAALLVDSVWGLDSNFSTLGLIGIDYEVDDDNNLSLSIDDTILTGYLQTNFNDVMALFVGQGTTTNSNVTYIGHSRDSEAGEYDVHINRAATRGTETGTVSVGSIDETLTITQGNSTAAIAITSGMTLDDIVNEINTELDTVYTQALVGDEQVYADSGPTNAITSETTWNSMYDSLGAQLSFSNSDTILFSGTSHGGTAVSGSYQISDVTSDTVQGLLSAIEDAFVAKVDASIDSSGRIVITDKYAGYSQLAITSISHSTEGEFFGTVDISAGAGDGSQTGRYAMAITATDDGSNHLVLRNDVYGSASFTLSQDNDSYDYITYSDTSNTTDSSSGTVYISGQAGGSSGTGWDDIYGASVSTSETITISGKDHLGTDITPADYTIDVTNDTVDDLLTAIQTAFGGATKADLFIRDGKIYLEDKTAGSSLMELTLTYNGTGPLSLGTFGGANITERDLELGLINGTVSGLDVAGTIDGEGATGAGQLLTGDDGNTNTDGLAISYTGTSDNVSAGTIKLTLGVAELFERALFSMTDPFDGYVAFKQDSLQASIERYDDQIEQMETRLDQKMGMMINKFVAMELILSQLQSQSDWLAGQINAAYSGWGSSS